MLNYQRVTIVFMGFINQPSHPAPRFESPHRGTTATGGEGGEQGARNPSSYRSSRENHGKTIGKLWENHGKTMGKPWDNSENGGCGSVKIDAGGVSGRQSHLGCQRLSGASCTLGMIWCQ